VTGAETREAEKGILELPALGSLFETALINIAALRECKGDDDSLTAAYIS
jgi:hypothetical protein